MWFAIKRESVFLFFTISVQLYINLLSGCSAIIDYKLWIYYVYEAKKLSIHLSVCVCLSVCVFGVLITQQSMHLLKQYLKAVSLKKTFKVCFYKPAEPRHCSLTEVPKRQRLKQPLTRKACGWWFDSHCTHCFILVKCFFIVYHDGSNNECQLNTVWIDRNGAFSMKWSLNKYYTLHCLIQAIPCCTFHYGVLI